MREIAIITLVVVVFVMVSFALAIRVLVILVVLDNPFVVFASVCSSRILVELLLGVLVVYSGRVMCGIEHAQLLHCHGLV